MLAPELTRPVLEPGHHAPPGQSGVESGKSEKPGVGVFDDPPQLIQDQTWLEFQCGGQGVRDLQQRGLFMRADFDPLVEVFFRLDALADIPDDAQKARGLDN